MEPLKTINSLQKSFVNKDLLKKRINKKNNYSNDKKKIIIIISFSVNHGFIV